MKTNIILTAGLAASLGLQAQLPVSLGKASYAAYPPPYKGKTEAHPDGFSASKMLSRYLYADETGPDGETRPLPTNDWWTDLMVSRFSGALWSYPAMLSTSEEGVRVCYPSYWYENGTEVKYNSSITVGAVKFIAKEARAADWHDWDVVADLPGTSGGNIRATLSQGSPFTWFEFTDAAPQISFTAAPAAAAFCAGGVAYTVGNDTYGIYYPESVAPTVQGGVLSFDGDTPWLVVALLPGADSLEDFAPYATSVVRSTAVEWAYDEQSAMLSTRWTVTAENLRDQQASAPVMQGFLPHVYKHALNSSIQYGTAEYLTPRGTMKMATSATGEFAYSYRFAGMLPYYAAPAEGDYAEAPYSQARMDELMATYASAGSFGADTYWGGKGLTQMALNMTFARQTGNDEVYQTSKARLKDALVDWFTYTPGESQRFFSYYPRWGGMLGFDVSYDSDTFNDHHFHYGYFVYASALLAMEDEDFRDNYGDMLRLIVKDYANYDRSDTRFPFLRTLSPWFGHSFAGGMGDAGNDNGNGQESSSEAMQGWGAVYLMGVALGDREMRDAGIFGWLTESRATAEYWFDRDHIYPDRQPNYDYSKYKSPYNTNITCKGIGWWTWFSGDPLWMHSIQWMPVSPCLSYLSEDLDFVKWDYEQMRDATAYSWFESSSEGDALAAQSVGNVVLCYMERYDPQGAALIFDEAWNRGMGMARSADTGHISYFVIHNHLTYGDIDFSVYSDCPTAVACTDSRGVTTYMVYNPDETDRQVRFFRNGALIKTVRAAGRRLSAICADPMATELQPVSAAGEYLLPGENSQLSAVLTDQYGARLDLQTVEWSVSSGAAIDANGRLTVSATTPRGSEIVVAARSAGLSGFLTIHVNERPRPESAIITGLPDFVETGREFSPMLSVTDQYGHTAAATAAWTLTRSGEDSQAVELPLTIARAGKYVLDASTDDGALAQTALVVLPPLPDVAHGKTCQSSSEENAGTLTNHATDGDPSSRWGSNHTDDEWIYVDLGAAYRITSVGILWEAAYGRDYDIEVSDDAESWTVVYSERGHSSAGLAVHPVAATGRYVRIRGIARGTVYGYSILELTVGGVRADAPLSTVVGLDLSLPVLAMEGEAVGVEAKVVTLGGDLQPAEDARWMSSPDGIFADGYFIPSTYGLHTISATFGDVTSQATLLVEESIKLASVVADPAEFTILAGDSREIALSGLDQFGGVYPLDSDTYIFVATERGDFAIELPNGATAIAHVRDVAEANLATGKPARASTTSGGNTAVMAVDSDTDTRWESEHVDGQWIAIDLGEPFVLSKVVLRWEGAYASVYGIETSMDGKNWTRVYETTHGAGGTETIDLPPVPASWVRVSCDKRATAWGVSLYEVEVYGSARFEASDNGDAPEIARLDVRPGNGAVSVVASATHPAGVVFFDVTLHSDTRGDQYASAFAVSAEEVQFDFSGLHSGLYELQLSVADAFGNQTIELRTVELGKPDLTGVNLALGKEARASSMENGGLDASKAVDGDLSTRWGSEFRDGETLTVDLGEVYDVEEVHIYWNTPAYATHYLVELSTDDHTYVESHSRAGWDGSADRAAIATTPARYVRLTGVSRATAYGTSVDELEVYGSESDFSGVSSVVAGSDSSDKVPAGIYDLSGRKLSSSSLLAPGIYLIDGRKHIVR